MANPNHPTIDEIIIFLNSLLDLDRDAISAIFQNYVPCNDSFRTHPTVQVDTDDGKCVVSMIGILNGLYGTQDNGSGFITKVVDIEKKKIVSFKRTGSN